MPPRISSLPPIEATTELLVLPYASVEGRSLVERLIEELGSGHWTVFRCALAFGKQSGNIPTLVAAMDAFLASGGRVSVTFGADIFVGQTKGTDYVAVRELLEKLGKYGSFALHLYHESGRVFHPKVIFFDNPERGHGLLIVGSSNWSEGGLFNNVEANVALRLDYAEANHAGYREAINELLDEYWGEE